MPWQAYVLAILFALLGLVCLASILIGLPGTWLLIGLALLLELVDHVLLPGAGAVVTFGWRLLILCTGLAVVGEVVEAAAGAAGTKLGGGSRRGMVGALVGGIVGAIVFTPLIPIPVVGTLLGALIGTFLGALVGELTGKRPAEAEAPARRGQPVRAAAAAAVGRLAGTLGKLVIASVVWVLLVRAALLP